MILSYSLLHYFRGVGMLTNLESAFLRHKQFCLIVNDTSLAIRSSFSWGNTALFSCLCPINSVNTATSYRTTSPRVVYLRGNNTVKRNLPRAFFNQTQCRDRHNACCSCGTDLQTKPVTLDCYLSCSIACCFVKYLNFASFNCLSHCFLCSV